MSDIQVSTRIVQIQTVLDELLQLNEPAHKRINELLLSVFLVLNMHIEHPETKLQVEKALASIMEKTEILFQENKKIHATIAASMVMAQTFQQQRDEIAEEHIELVNALREGDFDHPEVLSFLNRFVAPMLEADHDTE